MKPEVGDLACNNHNQHKDFTKDFLSILTPDPVSNLPIPGVVMSVFTVQPEKLRLKGVTVHVQGHLISKRRHFFYANLVLYSQNHDVLESGCPVHMGLESTIYGNPNLHVLPS